jgi:hypothetical protein
VISTMTLKVAAATQNRNCQIAVGWHESVPAGREQNKVKGKLYVIHNRGSIDRSMVARAVERLCDGRIYSHPPGACHPPGALQPLQRAQTRGVMD